MAERDEEAENAAAEERLQRLALQGGDPPAENDELNPEPDPAGDLPAEEDEMSTSTVPVDEDDPAEPDPAADPPAEDPPPVQRGARTLEQRIGRLAADKRAMAQALADAEAENVRLRAAQAARPPAEGEPDPAADPAAGDPPQRASYATQAEFDRAVRAEAARQANALAFTNRCNAIEDAGRKLGARWTTAKQNLALLDDGGALPLALLEPAMETDDPAGVLLLLGEDIDRAGELLAMTPTRRAMEIARMTPKKPTPPPRSRTPPPPEQIRGRGAASAGGDAPSDRDDDASWARKREEQLRAKRRADEAKYA